ncbi:MAG: copper amine oxidase N-terminal domain-containing protein, partial [Syntrophomonadaceae bacterium]|nr:copper amine oxidase N-terminal domain-containing protein [Syntrophomonadaceae bacterium]
MTKFSSYDRVVLIDIAVIIRMVVSMVAFKFFARTKRLLICIFPVAAVVVSMAVVFSTPVFAARDVSISIDGIDVPYSEADGFGAPFIDGNSRVQAPVRKTLETLGAIVEYDAAGRIVNVTLNDTALRFEIDGKAWLNGELYEIDTSATIIAGRTYIPVSYAVEPFGYSVKWGAAERNVLVRRAVDEAWTSPSETGLPMSMLNGPIGLVFPGPYGEIPDGEFYSYDRPHIMLVNTADFDSGEDIVFDAIDFEYRLFRVTDKGDEPVSGKAFSRFSGILPA